MNWRGGQTESKEVLPFFRRVGKRIKKRTNAGFIAEWLLRYYFNQSENHFKWVLGLFRGSLKQIWAFLLPPRDVRRLDSCAEDQKQTCTNPQNANNTHRCHNLSVVSQRVNVWTRRRARAYVTGYYPTFTSRLEKSSAFHVVSKMNAGACSNAPPPVPVNTSRPCLHSMRRIHGLESEHSESVMTAVFQGWWPPGHQIIQ